MDDERGERGEGEREKEKEWRRKKEDAGAVVGDGVRTKSRMIQSRIVETRAQPPSRSPRLLLQQYFLNNLSQPLRLNQIKWI